VATTPLIIDGFDGLRARQGQDLGVSEWFQVTQEDVCTFGKVTGDEYWIHTDPVRAAQSEFGGTIAHGFFTLSLVPRFMYEIFTVEGIGITVNYGAERLRFPAPLPVGDHVRMRIHLQSVQENDAGMRTTMLLTFERRGGDKPVCVAEWLGQYFRA
jgi:acyl dehydratase